jgi:PhnB protein
MKVNPYLNFDGNAEEAFNFYKSVFGGEFIGNMKMADAPGSDKLSKDEQNRTMHIALPIGDDTLLMASDIIPSLGHELNKGNNNYISLHPDSREEADRLFKGLSKGGDIEMHLQEQFWSDYYGSLTDRFGVKWMVNFKDQNEEMLKELEELLPEDTSVSKTETAPLS